MVASSVLDDEAFVTGMHDVRRPATAMKKSAFTGRMELLLTPTDMKVRPE
jgi:hypothetical protein